MTRSYWPLLLFLAAIWGASYLFIKVAVEEIAPTAMMFARLAIAAAMLVGFLVWQSGAAEALAELRDAAVPGIVLGAVNAALPFTAIAWGEQHIDSGVAAIANATVPLFNALIVIRAIPAERLSPPRLAGVLLGFAGVAVLAGANPSGGWWAVAGILAVVVASLSYAAGGVYGQLRVRGTRGPVLATASMVAGAAMLLPFAVWQRPTELPSWEATGSVLVLAVGGTAVAQLVLYRMLRLHGSARVSLVTYLMPPIALVYGAVLLDEPVTAGVVGGLGLILAGVGLGSGAVRLRRRPSAAATQHP